MGMLLRCKRGGVIALEIRVSTVLLARARRTTNRPVGAALVSV